MINGRLYYMMGPAGAGKSGVLGWVREHGVPVGVVCAQRYMTRPARGAGENLVTLSDEEFAAREQRGLFALTWSAHGVRYGIGREIEHWMNRGADVLVNGSRGAYSDALKRFPNLQPVVITADSVRLSARPAARDATSAMPSGALVIHNDGYPAHAGSQLLDAIRMRHAG
jgi:ribose 1,5-bisphosphokinase